MFLLFYLTKVLNLSIPLVVYAGFFPVWIVFFVLGLYLRKNKIQLSSRKLLVFTLLGLILSIAETYFTIWYTGKFTGLGIKAGAFVFSFFAIVFLFSLNINYTSNSLIWRALVYIGKISFGVYLIHMYFMSYLVRPLVSYLHINNWSGSQFAIISLTLGFCVIMIYIARKLNKSLAVKYLGF